MKRKSRYRRYFMPIPMWAMSYLVNSDGSSLDEQDRKTVDDWREKTRQGGRIDVVPTYKEDSAYFCRHPAFGLPTDVEDCEVVVYVGPKYGQSRYPCLGQSRFEPIQRQHLDEKWWWCVYDHKDHRWIPGYRCHTRRKCLLNMMMDFRHERLPFEPDNDLRGIEWLKGVQSVDEAMSGA